MLATVIFVLFCITNTKGHPQCLDFGPPFNVASPGLKFCSRYEKFSCCNSVQDEEIHKRYDDLLDHYDGHLRKRCKAYLRELLCLECSPYAAHVYDSERGPQRDVPGLCGPYCSKLYRKCGDVVRILYGNNTKLMQSMSTRSAFCSKMALPDVIYCHPDLETSPELLRNMSREVTNREGCVCLKVMAEKLFNPLALLSPPDGTGRLAVVEQPGVINMYNHGTVTRFLDIRKRVFFSEKLGEEVGLLGLAFHPEFKKNRKFYITYSTNVNGTLIGRVSQLKARRNQSRKTSMSTERVVLEVAQPHLNHNGGQLLFDLHGFLYIFLGDGGGKGDPYDNAQNMTSLLGKVLRVNINTNTQKAPYKIPRSNPFVCQDGDGRCVGWRPEIFAYGIRNIWRCDMDEGDPVTGHGRGRIICGDVGQHAWEEIDIIESGGNYGWNIKEGPACYKDVNGSCENIEREILPIHSYPHAVGQSVTGGHVYRGCENPNMMAWYIFADYMTGKIFKLKEDLSTGLWNSSGVDICGPELCFNGLISEYQSSILSFGEDDNGEVYMLTTSEFEKQPNGKVYKFVDPRRRGDPKTCRFQHQRER